MRNLKVAAYEMRHAMRDRLFRNNQPIAVNLRYAQYQAEVRKGWKPNGITPAEAETAERFHKDGYAVLPPVQGSDGADLARQVDGYFSEPANRHTLMDGAFRGIDGVEHIPSITSVIDKQLEHVLESYYRSYFKIFGIYFYRTLPTPAKPQSSFLWHLDNCPGPEIKLMVYLDDVAADTGAFRLKTKRLTDEIRAKGFRNRNQIQRVGRP